MDDDCTRSPSRVDANDVKTEEAAPDVKMAHAKPTYKSWKKKYRKMRIKFDEIMQGGEDLYRMEQKALKKAKQLAIFNDRLLDMLLDNNNCEQIPEERRFDLRLDIPPGTNEALIHRIDLETPPESPIPDKSLKQLLSEVPHMDFATVAERFPKSVADLLSGVDSPAADPALQQHPPSFLTADDIDNYMLEIDMKIKDERGEDYDTLPPTMASMAREGANGGLHGLYAPIKDASAVSISSTARDFALRNPTSVYNWLRKNAPGTFLQDAENANVDKNGGDHDHDDHDPPPKKNNGSSARAGGGRKSTTSGEGGGRTAASRATGSARAKRTSAAQAKDKRKSADDNLVDLDAEIGYQAPTEQSNMGSKGKRKRNGDDDSGYRPKGGASRKPSIKKRKSASLAVTEGDTGTAPAAAKRHKKSVEVEASEEN